MAKGGKTFQDREKASNVRTKILDELVVILSDEPEDLEKVGKWSGYKKDIIRRMSTSILPRLNEVTGEDGEPLKITWEK